MRKLGIGVLGVGEMGKRHAENVRRLVPEAELVAVADAAAARASQVAAELEVERSFSCLEDMLECEGVDCVLIATPAQFNNPDGEFTDSSFGVVTSARPPRIGQLGIKFLF